MSGSLARPSRTGAKTQVGAPDKGAGPKEFVQVRTLLSQLKSLTDTIGNLLLVYERGKKGK